MSEIKPMWVFFTPGFTFKKKKKLFMSALDMCCHGYGQGFTVEIIIFVHQDGGDSFRTAQLKIDHIRSIFYADVLKQNVLVCLL